LSGHQVPTNPLYHSPLQQDRGEENKMEKTRGSRSRQVIKAKAKTTCGSKGKQKIYSLLPISRPRLSTSQEAGLQYV